MSQKYVAITYWEKDDSKSMAEKFQSMHQGIMLLSHDLKKDRLTIDCAKGLALKEFKNKTRTDLLCGENISRLSDERHYIKNSNLNGVEYIAVTDEQYNEIKKKISIKDDINFNIFGIKANNCHTFVMRMIYGDDYTPGFYNIPCRTENMSDSSSLHKNLQSVSKTRTVYDGLKIEANEHSLPLIEITLRNEVLFEGFNEQQKLDYLAYQVNYMMKKINSECNLENKPEKSDNDNFAEFFPRLLALHDNPEESAKILANISLVKDIRSVIKNIEKYKDIIPADKLKTSKADVYANRRFIDKQLNTYNYNFIIASLLNLKDFIADKISLFFSPDKEEEKPDVKSKLAVS